MRRVPLTAGAAALALMTIGGCGEDPMRDQPRYDPLEPSAMFEDGASARGLPLGVVSRGELEHPTPFYTGYEGGKEIGKNPVPITATMLRHGQERFNVFCAPCHSRTGDGKGMIVLRGFTPPPSLHIERLRVAPDGHLFAVQTMGFGRMGSYAAQVPPEDRWAIAGYIRALQRSQAARIEDVPPEARAALEGGAR